MRLGLSLSAALLLGGVVAAGAQEAAISSAPASDIALALGQSQAMIAQAQTVLAAIDGLIEEHDARLDDLHRQRDAAMETAQDERAAQLDRAIDLMIVTLDRLEAERASIQALVANAQAQILALQAQPNAPTASPTDEP
jgi:hypothetical protein